MLVIRSICLCLCLFLGQSLGLSAIAKRPNNIESSTTGSESSNLELRLNLPPILKAGETATASVTDNRLNLQPNVAIVVQGKTVNGDSSGLISFPVPESGDFSIELSQILSQISPKKSQAVLYKPAGNGIYLSSSRLKESLLNILELHEGSNPSLLFAPAVLEIGQPFAVIAGETNLSKSPQAFVEGQEAKLLAYSSLSMVFCAPPNLLPGAARDLHLSLNDESTNSSEVDLSRLDKSYPGVAEKDPSPEEGTLKIIGSNLPCLIEVRNETPERANFWLDEKVPLGAHFALLSSGGDKNQAKFGIKSTDSRQAIMTYRIVSELPDLLTPNQSNEVVEKLGIDLNRGEIMRLKRRLVSIESRLSEARESRGKELQTSNPRSLELDKLNTEIKSLSLRQSRLYSMIAARKAIFLGLGGSPDHYARILDDATGGAYLKVEERTSPVLLGSASRSGFSFPAEPSTTPQTRTAKRYHRYLEPRIILLPPPYSSDNGMEAEPAVVEKPDSDFGDQEASIAMDDNQIRELGSKLRPEIPVEEPKEIQTVLPQKIEKAPAKNGPEKPPSVKQPVVKPPSVRPKPARTTKKVQAKKKVSAPKKKKRRRRR